MRMEFRVSEILSVGDHLDDHDGPWDEGTQVLVKLTECRTPVSKIDSTQVLRFKTAAKEAPIIGTRFVLVPKDSAL